MTILGDEQPEPERPMSFWMRAAHGVVSKALWLFVLFSTIRAAAPLLELQFRQSVEPAEVAVAVLAITVWSVGPYIVARAWDELGRFPPRQE